MDAHRPPKVNIARVGQKFEAEIKRLAAVSDEGKTRSIVSEVVDEVNQLIALPALHGDTAAEGDGYNVDQLLSYLRAEKNLCGGTRKRVRAPVPLRTRDGTGDCAPSPEPNPEIQRLIATFLDKRVEFRACSREQCCAELVGELTGEYTDAEPWAASSSDQRSTERPTEMDRMLLKAACNALPRLVETRARECLDGASADETLLASTGEAAPSCLPRELARCARLAAKLDADEARCCSDILNLCAEFEKRAALVTKLLAQRERLRRVRESCEQRDRLFAGVTHGLSDFRDSLASRLKLCESLIAAAENASPRREEVADATVPPDDLEGAAFDKRSTQLVAAEAGQVEELDQLRDRRKRMAELFLRLGADITDACQGSVKKWRDAVLAEVRFDKRRQQVVRALFIEFHRNPERFSVRMKSLASHPKGRSQRGNEDGTKRP